MTTRQKQIIQFVLSGPNQTRTSAEIISEFGHEYFGNGDKYVGARLTTLVRSGHLVRIKKGLYAVGGEMPRDANQAKLFFK